MSAYVEGWKDIGKAVGLSARHARRLLSGADVVRGHGRRWAYVTDLRAWADAHGLRPPRADDAPAVCESARLAS